LPAESELCLKQWKITDSWGIAEAAAGGLAMGKRNETKGYCGAKTPKKKK